MSEQAKQKFLEFARDGNAGGLGQMLENGQDPNISDENGVTALMYASEMGQLNCVRRLLQDDDVDVNATTDSTGYSALMYASMEGHSNIVAALVEIDHIDVHLKCSTKRGTTALGYAIQFKHPRCVEVLLSSGKIDTKTIDISEAVSSVEIIDILLKAGCPVNGIKDGPSPLSIAVVHMKIDSARRLLQEKDICVVPITKASPMSAATSMGYLEMVKLLSDNGFVFDDESVHSACRYGRVETLKFMKGADIHKGALACTIKYMHRKYASSKDLEDMVKILDILIERHANANSFACDGKTAYEYVVANYADALATLNKLRSRNLKTRASKTRKEKEKKRMRIAVDCLRKLNTLTYANPNRSNRTNSKLTPLFRCIEASVDIEFVKELLKNPRLDLNSTNHLCAACTNNRDDLVKLFIDDPRAENTPERLSSCLNIAIRKDNEKIVNHMLTSTNIDVNRADRSGETPLNECISNERLNIFKMLLKFPKTDVNAVGSFLNPDEDDDLDDAMIVSTPLLQALRQRKDIFIRLLLEMPGINVNKAANELNGTSPLQYVVWTDLVDYAKLLLERGADRNVKFYDGDSLLHFASRNNNTECLQTLLFYPDSDINPNIRNHKGETPLFCACVKGHIECVKILSSHPRIQMDLGKRRDDTLRVEPPMFAACCFGHLDIAKYLFESYINREISAPQHKEEYRKDRTALRKRLTLEFLSKSGSTINGIGDDTLLTISTFNGHRDVVEWLISLGVDIDQPNSIGLTAVTIASNQKNPFLAKFLANAGGHGNIKAVKRFLEKRKETDMILNRRGRLPSGVRQRIGSYLRVKSKQQLKF